MRTRKIKNRVYRAYCDKYCYTIEIDVKLNRPIQSDDLLDCVIEPVDAEDGDSMVWVSNYWFPLIDQYRNLWDTCIIEQDRVQISVGANNQNNQRFHLQHDGYEVLNHLSHLDFLSYKAKMVRWNTVNDNQEVIENYE